jgi:antimicrobial peptide system SdpB family protein
MDRVLTAIGTWVAPLAATSPWSSVYGLARTLLALATGLTLAFTPAASLFHEAAGLARTPLCEAGRAASLFCLADSGRLDAVRWGAVVALIIVASGWRPRLTGVVHWWITWSLQAVGTTIDGGDHLAANLTFLLVPATLTDPRRWHWSDHGQGGVQAPSVRRLVARSSLVMCQLQVAGVYFHAATGKLAVGEWADGTALYYWFTDPLFGAPGWLAGGVQTAFTSGVLLALATWAVIALELALSVALVLPPRARALFLRLGVLFHVGIAVVHGLVTFSVVMTAALVLYLRPPGRPFVWRAATASVPTGGKRVDSGERRTELAAAG